MYAYLVSYACVHHGYICYLGDHHGYTYYVYLNKRKDTETKVISMVMCGYGQSSIACSKEINADTK